MLIREVSSLDKANIVCYAWIGARDLAHGIPDLKGAVIRDVEYVGNDTTVLVLQRSDGTDYRMMIMPQEG